MTYNEVKDRIQYLGYLVSGNEATDKQKEELEMLCKLKKQYPEHDIEELKTQYLLDLERRSRQP